MWINSLGIETYVNNLFEDVKNGYKFYLYHYLIWGTLDLVMVVLDLTVTMYID